MKNKPKDFDYVIKLRASDFLHQYAESHVSEEMQKALGAPYVYYGIVVYNTIQIDNKFYAAKYVAIGKHTDKNFPTDFKLNPEAAGGSEFLLNILNDRSGLEENLQSELKEFLLDQLDKANAYAKQVLSKNITDKKVV